MAYKQENLDKVGRALVALDRCVDTLIKLMRNPDPDLREPAFLGFVLSLGEPLAIHLLFRAAGRTKNPAHRERIVGALGAIGVKVQEPAAWLLAGLANGETDAGVLAAIVRAVTAMGLAKAEAKSQRDVVTSPTDKKPDDPTRHGSHPPNASE